MRINISGSIEYRNRVWERIDLKGIRKYWIILVEWSGAIRWDRLTINIRWSIKLHKRVWVNSSSFLCFTGKEDKRVLLLKNGETIFS